MSSSLFAWEKNGKIITTDGSRHDVQSAILDDATVDGDTVLIPEGTFTWGLQSLENKKECPIWITKAITLRGAGRGKTIIKISEVSGAWTNAAVRILAPATIRDFTVQGAPNGLRAPFGAGNGPNAKSGWRITNIEFVQTEGKGAYFLYAEGTFGLVDNCIINGAAGNNELIFTRGPTNAWQTDDTLGTADSVYVEDCVFNGDGYVCDANSNAKMVVRFCAINGPMKVDGHGKASNSPPRGVRHMEIYRNSWNAPKNTWAAIELRGGTGMIFDNTFASGGLFLREYGTHTSWKNFGRIQTPKDYPIDDQIGTGKDPKVGGSEPLYLWNNNNSDGTPKERHVGKASQKSIEANGGVAFTEADIIAPDRDFFTEVPNFTGASGVGVGTRAKMDAIKPTLVGVGFWGTDEGDWNTKTPEKDGVLYVWDGKMWKKKYMPYTYPHPLRKDISEE